jgi:hypothetical protein
VGHVRLVVFHVSGNFTISLGMLVVLGLRADDELVHGLAGIAHDELDGLSLSHLDAVPA